MEILTETLQNEYNDFMAILPRLGIALLILVIAVLIGRFAGRSLVKVLRGTGTTSFQTTFIRRLTFWMIVTIGILVGLSIMGMNRAFASLLAGGGVMAIIFGFAFKDIGENFLAGFFLTFNRPFRIGDLIQSEDHTGIVRDIAMRHTHIRTEDGRDIFIPNAQIFNRSLINFTRDGLRRLSFSVGIDYADDVGRACEILLKEVPKVEGILPDPLPAVVLSGLKPQYVEITVIFWIDILGKITQSRNRMSEVMEVCRKTLLENGYTVSSSTITNLALGSRTPVEVKMAG